MAPPWSKRREGATMCRQARQNLEAIDAYAGKKGYNRANFLAVAAMHEMERERPV